MDCLYLRNNKLAACTNHKIHRKVLLPSALREIRRIIVHLIIFLSTCNCVYTVGLYTCGVPGSLDHVALHEGALCGSVCIPMNA